VTGADKGCDSTRVREIYEALRSIYPDAYSSLLEPNRGNPLDVLVATILSQATNDTLSGRAFDALKKAFPTWEDVLAADPLEVEKPLAAGGLQREKTKKIRETLTRIKADFGSITLDALSAWPAEKTFDYLVSLPGVGPKTAACVIGFGLGKPAFPVDTHVQRISKRLGLVPLKSPAEKTQKTLSAVVPPEIQMPLHVLMIRHGRSIIVNVGS
jgi:endonuclease-3